MVKRPDSEIATLPSSTSHSFLPSCSLLNSNHFKSRFHSMLFLLLRPLLKFLYGRNT